MIVRMYYRSGTGGRRCIGRRRFYSPGGGTFLCEMTSWPPYWNFDVKSKIDSVNRSVFKNNRGKFYPGLIWNDGALRFFWSGRPRQEEQQQDEEQGE